jgi:Ca2+/Na+ antiporter
MMQEIIIKENLDYNDFMKANFPQALQPFYKKRVFKINVAFGLVYLFISLYIFYQSFIKDGKIQVIHYSFVVFTLVFFLLAYYLAKREVKLYRKMFKDISQLETQYIITPDSIKVTNKNNSLAYTKKQLHEITELDKWLVFDFKNGERLSIYKPNITQKNRQFIEEYYSGYIK